MLTKPQTRENFRLRAFSGEAIMTAFAGVVTAVPTATPAPRSSRPPCKAACNGRAGACSSNRRAAGREVRRRSGLQAAGLRQGLGARDDRRDRRKAWEKIRRNADEVFTFGTVNGIRQPSWSPQGAQCAKEGYYAWIRADISAFTSPTRSGSRVSLSGPRASRALMIMSARDGARSEDHHVSIFGRFLCGLRGRVG